MTTPSERAEQALETLLDMQSNRHRYLTIHLSDEDRAVLLNAAEVLSAALATRASLVRDSGDTGWAYLVEQEIIDDTERSWSVPTLPGKWYNEHDNLVMLTTWMADNEYAASDVSDAVEKPWQWTNEFLALSQGLTANDMRILLDEYGEEILRADNVVEVLAQLLAAAEAFRNEDVNR